MSNIHWDFAETFSGRDAAYLIGGFDPSSNDYEEAYKVQPIIKRLKTAYYFACAEFRRDMSASSLMEKNVRWLHLHNYDKRELLSEHMLLMLDKFIGSELVASGVLDTINKCYEKSDHPDYGRMKILDDKNTVLYDKTLSIVRRVDPQFADELLQADKDFDPEFHESMRYQPGKTPVFFEFHQSDRERWAKMHRIVQAVDLDHDNACWDNANEFARISAGIRKWQDSMHAENTDLRNRYARDYLDATEEGRRWLKAYVNEFEDQKFTRSELNRWISDNNFPTKYQFSATPAKEELAEKPLGTVERNNLLRIVVGMAIDGYGYVPSDSKSPIPKQIENMLKLHGMNVTDDTVRKFLKEAVGTVLPKPKPE